MDDTKKALLSIDIDTAALTQNAANAKAHSADGIEIGYLGIGANTNHGTA